MSPSPTVALEYAQSSCSGDEEKSKVLAVIFEGKLGPSFFSPMDDFVSGNLHDSMDDHPIASAFKLAHSRALSKIDKEDGEGLLVDACKVFSSLRKSMSQSFDALWVDNGETPNLVVLNPSCLRIVQVLREDDVNRLEDAICDSDADPFGQENTKEQSLALLSKMVIPLSSSPLRPFVN